MRIVLFDEILERHVVHSLHRALEARGHDVRATGRIWKGTAFPEAAGDVARVEAALGRVLADPPDALLNFRTAALLPAQVERLRAAGVVTAAWFSDDPVLWATTTRHVAGSYDVLLHAGGERVLAHYEQRHGRSGVTFPFWTDEQAFPYGYDPERARVDVVFVGHTLGPAKRWRYDWLAAAARRLDLAFYGSADADPAGICRGWLRSDANVVAALATARLGLNISQRFADYAGTPNDFPGLAAMGEFPVPSRVVQFAAVGLPVVSLRTAATEDPLWGGMFPEATSVASAAELADLVEARRSDPEALRDWSAATSARFRRDFSAPVRAALLEDLLADPRALRGVGRAERARLYAGYAGALRRRSARRRLAAIRGRLAGGVGRRPDQRAARSRTSS